ncbi:hypothetical protein NADFUDRAFT_82603 [Nadsonia fulvescens var. elongata DSM 6958]|uniref:RNase III domain-containing protein n=1 Tax=Nadsonia fulvescens var. elongata DSM 6958 TaxID=857566 RepID=A0A1E3PJG9_9ASCO|nr:hypothetical protein NADFUDRAFT_82603 [Nadsonia fulvescens var. elongata DSM 6958]
MFNLLPRSTARGVTHTFIRSISYIKTPVRGLKKAQDSAMITAKGELRPWSTDAANLSGLKDFLGSEFALPDSLALQVLTHKSFQHGFKGYNEKLALIGDKLLKVHIDSYAIQQESTNVTRVNQINFDCLGSPMNKFLSNTNVLGEFALRHGLTDSIYWKCRLDNLGQSSPADSGLYSVAEKTMTAIVGAISLHHGGAKAAQFVNQKLLQGEDSLINIADEKYDSY